eukprot:363626-Chlamydomonas_euryale.AAC.7
MSGRPRCVLTCPIPRHHAAAATMKRTAHASGRVHRVPSLHLVASARPLTVRTSAKRVAAAPLNTPTTVAAASLSSTSPSRQLASAGAAAVASLCLLASPAQAAQLNTLADVMRDTFSFVDSNADGVVSMNELQQISSQVGSAGQQHATMHKACYMPASAGPHPHPSPPTPINSSPPSPKLAVHGLQQISSQVGAGSKKELGLVLGHACGCQSAGLILLAISPALHPMILKHLFSFTHDL